jgi:hypothetical protein
MNLAQQYARLADRAARRGDPASARIYACQAAGARRYASPDPVRSYSIWRRNLLWALEGQTVAMPSDAQTRRWFDNGMSVADARDKFLRDQLRGATRFRRAQGTAIPAQTYARLAARAARQGDPASARIYMRQAREAGWTLYFRLAWGARARGDRASARIYLRQARGEALRYEGWDESKHPRGQPGNKGQFASSPGGGGGGGEAPAAGKGQPPAGEGKAAAQAPAGRDEAGLRSYLESEFEKLGPGTAGWFEGTYKSWAKKKIKEYEEHGGAAGLSDAFTKEPTTPPPPGKVYDPDVEADADGDGITDAARVGVPAMQVPPPPPIGRLPNLTEQERRVESDFRDGFMRDPVGVAARFAAYARGLKPGEPPTFGTDDAKVLCDSWGGLKADEDKVARSYNRAVLNCAVHQTANAIAKAAFLQELDTMKPGDQIMVTVGGCGAGKGFGLKKVDKAKALKMASKAVWDSAGDQNATENPWVQQEAEKRGLKVAYAYVSVDPYRQWGDPEKGVVKRANDTEDGRMVAIDVFADSYAIGARNFAKFYEQNKGNPNASFIFLDNNKFPVEIPGIPESDLKIDRHKLAAHATKFIEDHPEIPEHIKRGARISERIWAGREHQ